MNELAPDDAEPLTPLVWDLEDSRVLTFVSDHVQSRMDLRTPDALLLEYTRVMMGFLLHQPAPQSIAMVGLGGGSLAKFCHRHLPLSCITVVEISLDVIALREAFAIPPDSERFSVLHGDAADFLRHNTSTYDVLLLDGFDANGVPPQLDTPQFYSDCQRALSPGGVLVTNLHACVREYSQTLRRLAHAFGEAPLAVPCGQGSNHLVFAKNDPARTLHTFREVRCPDNFDPDAWKTLLPSVARVALAARTRLMYAPAGPSAPTHR